MTTPAIKYTDPESGTVIDLITIDQAVRKYRDANTESTKRILGRQLTIFGISLNRIKRDLEKRVNVGMDMLLAADPSHKHEDDPRIDQWIQWKVDYEAVCDRLSAIENGVLRGRWDLVVPRNDSEVEATQNVEAA